MVVGLTFALAGCDYDMRSQLESEVKHLEAKCDALIRENETLRLAVDNLRAEKTLMEKDLSRLRSENNSLRRDLETQNTNAAAQIERLKAELAASVRSGTGTSQPVVPTSLMPAGSAMPAPGAASSGPDPQAVADADNAVADLQAEIAQLEPKVGQSRAKINNLLRATVDVPMVPPPGGMIRDGQVWRRDSDYPYYPYYRYLPVGPAVKKGDFPTQHEKEKAIQSAKEANLPLEQQLRNLRDQLDKAKAGQAKLRQAQQPVK